MLVLFVYGVESYIGRGCSFCVLLFFFFKQKTAYELRITAWSSDVCSSDLFPIVAFWRECLMTGHDEIALTLSYLPRIESFEAEYFRSPLGACPGTRP